MTKRLIQVFFKAPIEGKVKTRLIPKVGLPNSVIIHQRLCEQVIQCVAGYAEQSEDIAVQFWVDLDISHTFVQDNAARYGVDVFQQKGSDLGERMQFAMTSGLMAADQVVIVGGDCFSLCERYLAQAFEVLENKDVVFGPADDGGYILIGSHGLEKGFFTDVQWGESTVLASSIDCAHQSGKSYGLLEERWDIDTWEDIHRNAPQLLEGLNRC
ncbi:MAG: TIGR04282 family arsenosugar biosynthesis glycosyltransferase [Flavobacteriales bacterium]|nr:TIGR04282 family arsenosugar biosynthesis glycosyltransferase [Flavobacteriales bacterium]